MRDLEILQLVDKSNNAIKGATVIAFSQDVLFSNVSHTDGGQNFPAMEYLRMNATFSNGQCIIRVFGKSKACLSWNKAGNWGTGCHTHVET